MIIALDSMCFIYHFEKNPFYSTLVDKIFSSITSGKSYGITSTITITETLSASNQKIQAVGSWAAFIERFMEMKNLQIKEVNLSIAKQAAVLRSLYRLKLGDAIQLATAVNSQSKLFVTNDIIFRRVKELKIMILDDLL